MITPFFNNISPFEDIRSNHNNNNNNTYRAPISILLFSSALKNKNIKKKIRLHKVYMQKVHEPTKKSQTIMSTLKTIKIT